MLTTLLTFGLLTGSSLRGFTETTRSRSIFNAEADFFFRLQLRAWAIEWQHLYTKICFSWGSMDSPKVPRAVQKRVCFLGGRCGSDGLLPVPHFLTSVRSDGPREFTPTPKGFQVFSLVGLSLGLIVRKRPTVATISGPSPQRTISNIDKYIFSSEIYSWEFYSYDLIWRDVLGSRGLLLVDILEVDLYLRILSSTVDESTTNF